MTKAMGEVMLDRRDVVSQLLAERGDALVVSGLGSPTYDVAAVSPSQRNYYLWGAMGGAVMVGLGLALAQPQQHIIVVTGDGEALMGMGALATVGAKQPGNLSIVVLDNEHYGETGMQQSHLGMGVDLCGVAKSCGIANANAVQTIADLKLVLKSLHSTGAPKYIHIKVDPATPARVMPTRDAVENKLSFRAALGVTQN